ncbi:hypothetical protein ACWEOE_10880 [Amycolatopsis sp. NPDC004368]
MIEDGPDRVEIIRTQRVGRDQDLVTGTVAVIENCVFTPSSGVGGAQSSVGAAGATDQVISQGTLYAPPSSPVPQAGDRIKILGETWECDGRPAIWQALDGDIAGYEQRLKKVVG